ncbi:MAG: hypothetical protein QXO70_02780 [Candidatus Pacearchaeota archaeon]
MLWQKGKEQEERIVEAIEGGRIVRVTEDYAKREGLLILRANPIIPSFSEKMGYKKSGEIDLKKEKDRKMIAGMDDLRRPLRSKEGDVTKELIENFHWKIAQRRREKGLTRKQVALAIGESENDIKIIENGILPTNNFVLVSKLENYFGINLRKHSSIAPSLTKELSTSRVGAVLKRVAEKGKEDGGKEKQEIIADDKKSEQNKINTENEEEKKKEVEVVDFFGDEIELIGEDKEKKQDNTQQ